MEEAGHKARVDSLGCKTFAEFKRAVVAELKGVPKRMCVRLVASMGTRLAKVREFGGDKCGY
jgi:hypothetical protein